MELADNGDVNKTIIKSNVVLSAGDQRWGRCCDPNQVRLGRPTCWQARQILNYHVTMHKHAATQVACFVDFAKVDPAFWVQVCKLKLKLIKDQRKLFHCYV